MDVCIPVAIQVVIDDVGWWSGKDDSASGGPFRTGIGRDHVSEDYSAVIELGRRLNMRPQAAMVLCEWDRTNILRMLPSSTWMGERWDNSKWAGCHLDKTAEIIRNGTDYIELTLHAIGHEYWENGKMSRAEWHDSEGRMRPKDQIIKHLEYYQSLMDENGLGKFPESFVPSAFLHCFGLGSDGLAAILARYGIKYISTPFHRMHKALEPQSEVFGIDEGILTVDRGEDLFSWNETAPFPEGEIQGPVCGMHWPQILHPDPGRNHEVVDRWVDFLSGYGKRFDFMLARNTGEAYSQAVYRWGTGIEIRKQELLLDFTKIDRMAAAGLKDYLFLKVSGDEKIKIASEGLAVSEYSSDESYPYRLLKVKRKVKYNGGKIVFESMDL